MYLLSCFLNKALRAVNEFQKRLLFTRSLARKTSALAVCKLDCNVKLFNYLLESLSSKTRTFAHCFKDCQADLE